MDCVVRTWLLGTISDDLADTVSERHATARDIWLAIESQFLGNQATRALYADADFRNFCQGDLSVADYCRLYKRKAEDLRDLGEPVSDRTLVLNIIRGLNERFAAIGLHLRRTNPLPSFLQVRDDLRIEELTMAKAAPATALFSNSSGGKSSSNGTRPSGAPPQQQQGPPGFSSGASLSAVSAVARNMEAAAEAAASPGAAMAQGTPAAGPAAAADPLPLHRAAKAQGLAAIGPATTIRGQVPSTCGLGLVVRPARRLLGRPSPLTPSSLGHPASGPVSGACQPQIQRWVLLLPTTSTTVAGISRP